MHFTYPYLDQITKFNPKMQDFKRVLDLNSNKRKIQLLNFFNWLSNVKNLVLWNGSEYVGNVIQWCENSFFLTITKNRSAAGGVALRPP